jgi:hypothetical protein
MQADLDKEDSAPRVSVVIASGMHVDQSTSESLSAEPQMAGLHVGDCVLRRGELHKVVEIDNSLSPIALTVQNLTTGAVVATELPFLSLPKRESLSAERHSVLPAVSFECDNTGPAQVSPASAIKTAAAWVRLPAESRLRRQALLEQKAKRESIDIPAAAKSIALQNMLRVHGEGTSMHHISKINGRPATLVDPGAQVSASSDFDLEECITVIDPTDRVDLKSFSGNREQLLCLGSTTKQKISQTTTGALTVFVWKEYILKTNTSINIMSIHELEAAGGSAHFGTNDELRITQTVAGQVRSGLLLGRSLGP